MSSCWGSTPIPILLNIFSFRDLGSAKYTKSIQIHCPCRETEINQGGFGVLLAFVGFCWVLGIEFCRNSCSISNWPCPGRRTRGTTRAMMRCQSGRMIFLASPSPESGSLEPQAFVPGHKMCWLCQRRGRVTSCHGFICTFFYISNGWIIVASNLHLSQLKLSAVTTIMGGHPS